MRLSKQNTSNFLLSEKYLKQMLLTLGEKDFKKEIIKNKRCSGMSTIIALDFISTAIKNPNKQYKIIDHFPTKEADEALYLKVRRMIETLNLKGFNYPKHLTIMFCLYEKSPKQILKEMK